jgi:septal ring factor EnvC (AmiA/AmiB activator)
VIAQDPREPVQELVRLRAKVNLLLAMNSCAMSDRQRDLERISRLNTELQEKDNQLSQLRELIQEKDNQLSALRQQLQELFASTSWKMTVPLRRIGSWVKRSRAK